MRIVNSLVNAYNNLTNVTFNAAISTAGKRLATKSITHRGSEEDTEGENEGGGIIERNKELAGDSG